MSGCGDSDPAGAGSAPATPETTPLERIILTGVTAEWMAQWSAVEQARLRVVEEEVRGRNQAAAAAAELRLFEAKAAHAREMAELKAAADDRAMEKQNSTRLTELRVQSERDTKIAEIEAPLKHNERMAEINSQSEQARLELTARLGNKRTRDDGAADGDGCDADGPPARKRPAPAARPSCRSRSA